MPGPESPGASWEAPRGAPGTEGVLLPPVTGEDASGAPACGGATGPRGTEESMRGSAGDAVAPPATAAAPVPEGVTEGMPERVPEGVPAVRGSPGWTSPARRS